MKVLFVTAGEAPDAQRVLSDLLWLDTSIEAVTVIGTAAALEAVRTGQSYSALFIDASIAQNDALALVSSIRRDRTGIAIVVLIDAADRTFFAHAIAAGADDVLMVQGEELVAPEDTLRRIRQNRHVPPASGQHHLQVLYVGQDELTWSILSEIPFALTRQATAREDGSVPLSLPGADAERPADVIVVDEQPGDVHPLLVVRWLDSNTTGIRVVALTSPVAGDLAGAAVELGADEVVSKAGSYRRRLVASLHRLFLSNQPGPATQSSATAGAAAISAEELRAAEERIEALSETAQTATIALTTLRAEHDLLRERQAFERALRDRDREELATVTRALREEQERRQVLERTLSQEEDRAKAEVRRLQEDVAKAADRLHQVAHNTQLLQTRLETQLAERVAERDRVTDNALIGHAVFARDGRLLRCSDAFATMLGYGSSDAAVSTARGEAFNGTPDHAEIVRRLDAGGSADRITSTLRRADGRPVRVLTAALVSQAPETDDGAQVIERLFVDLSGQAAAEKELLLARRLESAGRLAAEMAPEIEAALNIHDAELDRPTDSSERVSALVRQLLAYSRQQARPAGYLSLNDAVARLEPVIRQLAGGAVDVRLNLGAIEPVTAGEDDIEQLITAVATAAAVCLPYGGRVTIATASETDSAFVLNTSLTATAAGYGVLPYVSSSSLVRLAARCGGTLRFSGEAGRTSTLHVNLPC